MNTEKINLSYVLATYNKLPYLKTALDRLIKNKKADEEILVIDGGSKDGTAEYLEKLKKDGHIDYVSEPDYGEAHADNKGFNLARGEIIKIITDDDAFYYPGIDECKKFMLENPEIDLLSTDGIKRRPDPIYPFSTMLHQNKFNTWKRKHTPFVFCGLGLMIRKSSLPLLGFLDTTYARVDAEYALRVTAGKGKIAWYAHECFAHIRNVNSNSYTQEKRIKEEQEKLDALYFPEKFYLPLKQKLRSYIEKFLGLNKPKTVSTDSAEVQLEQWVELFETSEKWLSENGRKNKGQFLQ